MREPLFIADYRDVLPTLRNLLAENGNSEIAVEPDPWEIGSTMYVFERRLFISKAQAPIIRKYLHNLKAGQEQDFFFAQSESGNKVRVIWQGSADYQAMQKQKAEHYQWQKTQQETRQRVAHGIAAAKAEGRIRQPAAVRIEASVFERVRREIRGDDRAAVLNQVLAECGVGFLSGNAQPDGVYFYILDRAVEIPRAWYGWLEDGNYSWFSFGYRSLDGLSFGWNRYSVAGEDTYIQYKAGIW